MGEVYFSHIDKDASDDYVHFFSVREWAKIKRMYRNPVRMASIISGRMLIKKLIAERNGNAFTYKDIEVLNGTDGIKGQPQLYIKGELTDISISISYADGYVCVGISDKAFVGVDIEKVRLFSDCFVNMFYVKENAETINCMNGIGQTEMWCIQEAYLKAMGIGFEVGLKGLHIRLSDLEQCDAKVISSSENGICQVICFVNRD
ncbi:4'-phosphopantetheinyl transferase family protein [Butyrivibrio sp. M55]|uniref:4'-phosphopantetheinyl transferase family protein n=1 Tax=Butyrivibrio sp. M55 TaxID=1855323 RepID=UPI001587BEA7|nr:4'-phosphopantetheinyl transferase superfamily protein [Butyrivibrio sp. M55]